MSYITIFLQEALNMLEAQIRFSGSKIISSSEHVRVAMERREKAKCQKWGLTTPFKSKEFKNKMVACKAKAFILGDQAAIKYASSMLSKCKGLVTKYIADLKDDIEDNKYYL